jgi:hypothetical protein
MRFRPSGDSFLFFFAGFAVAGATAAATFFGLPAFFFPACGVPPLSRARACCNWVISLSMLAKMSEIAMNYSP